MTTWQRLTIILLSTVLYWAAGLLLPVLIDPTTIKWLCGLFAFLLTLELFAYGQLNATTGLGVLNGSQIEKLSAQRDSIRKKFFITASFSVVTMIALFIVSLVSRTNDMYIPVSLAVGFLVGVGLNYLAVLISWISQLARFADRLREIEQHQKDFSDQVKRLNEARKVV